MHHSVELIQLLHEQYELLRAEALDSSRSACGQGLMTLLSRGMAGWIESLQAQYERTSTTSSPAICVANSGLDRDWVQALAALVMGLKRALKWGAEEWWRDWHLGHDPVEQLTDDDPGWV